MVKKRDKLNQAPVQNAGTAAEDVKFLDIIYVDIDKLVPNEYNPNRQSDHEFELLCRSIEEDGFTQPIFAHKDTYKIIDGEHRWRALKVLGYTQAPCCLTTMDEIQAKIATLRHNRARGNEDIQRAADVFRELEKMGALSWAADSLILDQVELNFMTNMIPTAQLQLRTEGMSYDQTQETLEQERAMEVIKAQQEQDMIKKDQKKYTLQLTYLSDEGTLVREVIGKSHAEGILNVCRWAMEQKRAQSEQTQVS